jgi:DNA polymerase I
MKNKRIASAEVMERFGVPPDKVVQVQALAGDSTDNVPGVRGIGVKTAAELINSYGDVETLLARGRDQAEQAPRNPDRECGKCAHLARLVTLDDKVPMKEGPMRIRGA